VNLVGRYLYPARVVPLTRANLTRVAASLGSSYRAADTAAMPSAVGIDVSDACNIACAVCSREVDWDKRDTAILKLDRFRHLYDQIRPVYLSLSGYGETLLNKHVPAMVAHAVAGGSRVTLVTNGTLLDNDHAHALLEAGLARLKVSVDAADPEVYAKVRVGADLEVVLGNVERLVLMRDARRLPSPVVELQFTVFRDNVDQVEKLVELCHRRFTTVEPYFHVMFTYGEQAAFVEKTLPAGSDAVPTLRRAAALARRYGYVRTASSLDTAVSQLTTDLSSAPCFIPWYSCIVSTDGDVYPCCYHTIRGTKVGNALQTPFSEIWNGPEMRAFRAALRTRRCDDKVCATCRYEDAPLDKVFGVVRRVTGG
jgi:radical SAM protein with 4Fe4S-binding SPASM domain